MKRMFQKIIVGFICNYLLFLPLINAYAAEGLAFPAGDLIAPEIQSPPITEKLTVGELPTIHATVTDNVGVKSVTIFYRDMGDKEFLRKEMLREPGTDDYSVTLPAIVAPGVEYYLQATDLAGNTLLHGHTFAPLTLNVDVQPGSVPTAVASKKPEQGVNKWVWIGLGVLAVGALAGGGGGGGGGTETPPSGKTGTIVISAPPP